MRDQTQRSRDVKGCVAGHCTNECFAKVVVAVALLAVGAPFLNAKQPKKDANTTPILWGAPTDIATRDLMYGIGGKKHAPEGPFTFDKEDLDGNSPKFVVKDSQGVKWKVKVGAEARPETVATRLVWAVGYSTDEDYFLPAIHVDKMPAKLKRGGDSVSSDGTVRNARWERMEYKKAGIWPWNRNPFNNTRELDGLRVLMSLLNNYDMKDSQNDYYDTPSGRVYVVADLGATLGSTGSRWPQASTRGDLAEYSKTDFIKKATPSHVDFAAPSWPMLVHVIPLPPLPYPFFTAPVRLFGMTPAPEILGQRWIGKGIPREHVRWIAGLLGKLSHNQIRDAFRSGGYSETDVDGFTRVMESRISKLGEL